MLALRRVAVVFAILALVISAAVPVIFAAGGVQLSSVSSFPAVQGNARPAITTAPVSIHFKLKATSGFQGGSVTVSATVKNTGGFDFVATSCNLWYRLGTSGAWTKAGVCLNPSDFPFTFPASSNTKFSASQSVSQTFPTGTYQWKIQLLGTYNGIISKSHSGKITVTIT